MRRKVLTKEERCQVAVSPPGMWGAFQQHQCYNKAVITIEGKRYCRTHSPETVGKRDNARTEKYNKELANRKIEWSAHTLLAACKEALEVSHNPIVEKILIEAINKAEGHS